MELVRILDANLTRMGFIRVEGAWIAGWTLKTWNVNRGVVMLELPEGRDPVEFVNEQRGRIAAAMRYTPFFYTLGMQFVLVGRPSGRLAAGVDSIDNQTAIVQSIFVVDPVRNETDSARTWGQYVTGTYQDAIQSSIDEALGRPFKRIEAPGFNVVQAVIVGFAGLLLIAIVLRMVMGG